MNLTLHYVKWVFRQINRGEIVKNFDDWILDKSQLTAPMLDLSLSQSMDDYEFEKKNFGIRSISDNK
jgi:hypothetical protein